MIGRLVQDCADGVDYRPIEDSVAGEFVHIGSFAGFVRVSVKAGELGALSPVGGWAQTRAIPKGAVAFDCGAKVFLGGGDTAAASGSVVLGVAVPQDGTWEEGTGGTAEAAATADDEVWVYTGSIPSTS